MFCFYSSLENPVDQKENSKLRVPSRHKAAEKPQKGLTTNCSHQVLQQRFRGCRTEVWAEHPNARWSRLQLVQWTQRSDQQRDVLSISWPSTHPHILWTLGLRKKAEILQFKSLMSNLCRPMGSSTEPVIDELLLPVTTCFLSLLTQAVASAAASDGHRQGLTPGDWEDIWVGGCKFFFTALS